MLHADILGERARLSPTREAILEVATGRRWSYGDADCRAVAMARVWREALGLRRGDRVGLLAHNRIEHVDAYFAAAKSGVILVPLSTRLTAAELAHPVADSGMRALFYEAAVAGTVAELRRTGSLEHFVTLDERESRNDSQLQELVDRLAERGCLTEMGVRLRRPAAESGER